MFSSLLELIANGSLREGKDARLCREQEEGRTLPPCLAYLFHYADIVSPHFQTFFGKYFKEGCRDSSSGHLPNVSGTLPFSVNTHCIAQY